MNREEYLKAAAERMRLAKEKEEKEEKEYYERVTSGNLWIFFKVAVVCSTLVLLISLIDTLFDGPEKSLTEKSWEIDRNWRYDGHSVLDVEGYLFTPKYLDWATHKEETLTLVYSPILRTGKKLNFDSVVNGEEIISYSTIRFRSLFNWFPYLQIFLLIPIVTYLFKRQSPWFNFARVFSLVFVLPGSLIIIFFTYF